MPENNDHPKPASSEAPKPQAPPPERIHEPSVIMETRNGNHDYIEIKTDKTKTGQ